MNNPAITKEELLTAAEEIVNSVGLENLNIRQLAQKCNISVGCIYNYYASKSELILALIEKFWSTVLKRASCEQISHANFLEYIKEMYSRLSYGLQAFTTQYRSRISTQDLKNTEKRKEIEEAYWERLKLFLMQALEEDDSIKPEVWNSFFSKTEFVEYTFLNMMEGLRRGKTECGFLAEVVNRCLY